jgi:hypothetical protein
VVPVDICAKANWPVGLDKLPNGNLVTKQVRGLTASAEWRGGDAPTRHERLATTGDFGGRGGCEGPARDLGGLWPLRTAKHFAFCGQVFAK